MTVVPKDAAGRDALDRKARQIEHEHTVKQARIKVRAALHDRSPYGPASPHSWVRDSAFASIEAGDVQAEDRLQRFRASVEEHHDRHGAETRAITSSTLGGLIPATIPPYVQEAVAYGVRSTAPLATALLRLDLPPVGMSAAWAKVTTGATVTNQTAENTALTASSDEVVASATDALGTIGSYVDFSAQSQEMSGGWFEQVIGEELGRAFGARLEQQVWNGSGSSGQLKGFAQMTGNSSSTVAGQTIANQTAKVAQQFDAVSTNLGSVPNLVAMAPRRYAGLQSLSAAIGLPVENLFPEPVRENIIVSPAAPLTLGGGSEDWIVLLNRGAVPLVRDAEPTVEFTGRGQAPVPPCCLGG
jgi:HK97 family phage major capsid protein